MEPNMPEPRTSIDLRMALRVYTVTRDGIIQADSGTREIAPAREPLPIGEINPPRACARHRAGQPAVSR
ncbi:hypothetical protein O3S80_13635 [Streptomyces sp. Lzd4kr]|nr:hypothetical protein [Streptomyces sp. Lzd4kr]